MKEDKNIPKMKAYIMQRGEYGLPTIHSEGTYVTLNKSLAMCLKRMNSQRTVPMFGTWHSSEEESNWAFIVLRATDSEYPAGTHYEVSSDGSMAADLGIVPMYEVTIKTDRVVFDEGENKEESG